MFVATLNKTLKSYLFAIIGAEYVLQWLPIGTHDWDKFIKPEDLIKISKVNNLKLEKLDGMKFNIFNNSWEVSNDVSVNYIAKFIKKRGCGIHHICLKVDSIDGAIKELKENNIKLLINILCT